MERDAQRAVRRITDHQEIVKQYQKVVRAYNNFMRDYPWMTDGLMQDNCRFGDMLKDEKRKSQFKYELGRLMGEYAVPLPLGNFSLNNKETRRLELWKNHRGMWFDHVEHMEEGPEQNKEWENFWWTVDEDMFTYVMKTKIEELIDEKLNQEFPEEVEIRMNQEYDSEEEVTSETEETDDDESETDNAGENKVLERESDKKELGIIFEYTAPGTPHQNGVVERAFVTVMGRARAMMNHAGFTMVKRQQLWCEAAQTATMLDNILVQESAKSPPFTQFF